MDARTPVLLLGRHASATRTYAPSKRAERVIRQAGIASRRTFTQLVARVKVPVKIPGALACAACASRGQGIRGYVGTADKMCRRALPKVPKGTVADHLNLDCRRRTNGSAFSTARLLNQPDEHKSNRTQRAPKKPLRETTRELRDNIKNRLANITEHENIYTIPNLLTVSRLVATPVIGYLVIHDQHAWAVGLFAYAGITDSIDGWIARNWHMQSVVGTVLDPMADKILMATLVACLAFKGALPLWLAALIFGRDASLGLAAIYYRWTSLPAPKTFTRYWDFSIPSAEVHPTTVSKFNTFLQLGLIGSTLTLPIVPSAEQFAPLLTGAQALVAATTVWSGASYVWEKSAVTILEASPEEKDRKGRRGRLVIGSSFALVCAAAGWLAVREDTAQKNIISKEAEDRQP